MNKGKVVTIILGGGKGTRLFPLTLERSKPAVPFGAKYRLIDIPISNCINSNLNRIFILTQFNSESLNRHINETYQFDSFRSGFVSLLAAEQTLERKEWFQGTADAVRQTLRHIRVQRPEFVLILSGDQLYHMDFRKLWRYHLEQNSEITIATLPVSHQNASSFGILQLDQDDKILKFTEKPPSSDLGQLTSKNIENTDKPFLASMGIYFFNYEILEELLLSTDFTDFGHHIIPYSIEHHKVYGYIFDDYWDDIGSIKSFYRANLSLTDILPKFTLYNEINHPIYFRRRYLPPAKVRGSRIDQSIIASGAIIEGATMIRSLIGIRAIIKKDTTIINSVVFGNDYYQMNHEEPLFIGEGCHIERTIIDKNVRIGDHVVIRNHKDDPDVKEDLYWIKDGITVIKKGAVIPSHMVI